MKRILSKLFPEIFFIAFFFLSFSASLFAQTSELTLQECYEFALRQSEKVAIQQQMIQEAEARFTQSLSGVLPKATFEYSNKRQKGSNTSNFSLTEIPEEKFIFSQPLFSGFKEFASMGASRAERRQRTHETRRAQEMLFIDVSDAFYFFLSYQEDIEALETTQNALTERIQELKKREALGRSRPSEVASAEVLLNRNEAELELVRSQKEVSRQLLEFLTGQRIEKVRDSEEFLSFPNASIGNPDGARLRPPTEIRLQRDLANLKDWRTFGGDSFEISPDYTNVANHRADVLAAKEALTAAQKNITVARAGWWPTAGLDGNYYTKRVGNSSDVTWDFTFKVDVPIFDGGETFGAVREAQSLAKQAQLSLQETQRNAALEIQNAATKFQTALKRRNALKKALEAAEKNYHLQKEDYQKSLVNNLDVLESLQDLQSVRRDFITARFEAKRSYWSLKVAAGEAPGE